MQASRIMRRGNGGDGSMQKSVKYLKAKVSGTDVLGEMGELQVLYNYRNAALIERVYEIVEK